MPVTKSRFKPRLLGAVSLLMAMSWGIGSGGAAFADSSPESEICQDTALLAQGGEGSGSSGAPAAGLSEGLSGESSGAEASPAGSARCEDLVFSFGSSSHDSAGWGSSAGALGSPLGLGGLPRPFAFGDGARGAETAVPITSSTEDVDRSAATDGSNVTISGGGTWGGTFTAATGDHVDTITIEAGMTATGQWNLDGGADVIKRAATGTGNATISGQVLMGAGNDRIGGLLESEYTPTTTQTEKDAAAAASMLAMGEIDLGAGDNKVRVASVTGTRSIGNPCHAPIAITGGSGSDTIEVSGSITGCVSLGGGTNSLKAASIDIYNAGGSSTVVISGAIRQWVSLGGGTNNVTAQSVVGNISSGDGNDTIKIQEAATGSIYLNDGINVLEVGSLQGAYFSSGSATDTIIVKPPASTSAESTIGTILTRQGTNKLFLVGNTGSAATRKVTLDLSNVPVANSANTLYICNETTAAGHSGCGTETGGNYAFNVALEIIRNASWGVRWPHINVSNETSSVRSLLHVGTGVTLASAKLNRLTLKSDGSAGDVVTFGGGIAVQAYSASGSTESGTLFELDLNPLGNSGAGASDQIVFNEAAKDISTESGLTDMASVRIVASGGDSIENSVVTIGRVHSGSDIDFIRIWDGSLTTPAHVSSGGTITLNGQVWTFGTGTADDQGFTPWTLTAGPSPYLSVDVTSSTGSVNTTTHPHDYGYVLNIGGGGTWGGDFTALTGDIPDTISIDAGMTATGAWSLGGGGNQIKRAATGTGNATISGRVTMGAGDDTIGAGTAAAAESMLDMAGGVDLGGGTNVMRVSSAGSASLASGTKAIKGGAGSDTVDVAGGVIGGVDLGAGKNELTAAYLTGGYTGGDGNDTITLTPGTTGFTLGPLNAGGGTNELFITGSSTLGAFTTGKIVLDLSGGPSSGADDDTISICAYGLTPTGGCLGLTTGVKLLNVVLNAPGGSKWETINVSAPEPVDNDNRSFLEIGGSLTLGTVDFEHLTLKSDGQAGDTITFDGPVKFKTHGSGLIETGTLLELDLDNGAGTGDKLVFGPGSTLGTGSISTALVSLNGIHGAAAPDGTVVEIARTHSSSGIESVEILGRSSTDPWLVSAGQVWGPLTKGTEGADSYTPWTLSEMALSDLTPTQTYTQTADEKTVPPAYTGTSGPEYLRFVNMQDNLGRENDSGLFRINNAINLGAGDDIVEFVQQGTGQNFVKQFNHIRFGDGDNILIGNVDITNSNVHFGKGNDTIGNRGNLEESALKLKTAYLGDGNNTATVHFIGSLYGGDGNDSIEMISLDSRHNEGQFELAGGENSLTFRDKDNESKSWGGIYGSCSRYGYPICPAFGSSETVTIGPTITVGGISTPLYFEGGNNTVKGAGTVHKPVVFMNPDGRTGNLDRIGIDPAGPDGDMSTTADNPSQAELDASNSLRMGNVTFGHGQNRVYAHDVKLWAASVGAVTSGSGDDTFYLKAGAGGNSSVNAGTGTNRLYFTGMRGSRGSRLTLNLSSQAAAAAGDSNLLYLCNEAIATAGGCGSDSANGDYAYDVVLNASGGASGWDVNVKNQPSTVNSWLTVKGSVALPSPELENTVFKGDGASGGETTITGTYKILDGAAGSTAGTFTGTVFELDVKEEDWTYDTLVFGDGATGATGTGFVKIPAVTIKLAESATPGNVASALLDIVKVHSGADVTDIKILGETEDGDDRKILFGDINWTLKTEVEGSYTNYFLDPLSDVSTSIAVPGTNNVALGFARNTVTFTGTGDWSGTLTYSATPVGGTNSVTVPTGVIASGAWSLPKAINTIKGQGSITGNVTLGDLDDTIGNHDAAAPADNSLVFGGTLALGEGDNKVRAASAMSVTAGAGKDTVELGAVATVTSVNVNLGGGENTLSLEASSAAAWGGSYGTCASSGGQTTCSGGGDGPDSVTVGSSVNVTGSIHLGAGNNTLKGAGDVSARVTALEGNDTIGLDPAGPDGDMSTTADNPSQTDLDAANALSLATVNLGAGINTVWGAASVGTLTAGAGNDTIFLKAAPSATQSVSTGAGSDNLYVAGRRGARGGQVTLALGPAGSGNSSQLHLCNESVSAAGCGADATNGDYAYNVVLDASAGASGWTVSVQNEASSVQSWLEVKGTATLSSPGLEDTFLKSDGATGTQTTISGDYRIENGTLDDSQAGDPVTTGTVFQIDLSESDWTHDTLVFASDASGAAGTGLVKVPAISVNLIKSATVGSSAALLDIARIHRDSDVTGVTILGAEGGRIILDGDSSRKHSFLISSRVDGDYTAHSLQRVNIVTIALPSADAVELTSSPISRLFFTGTGTWSGNLTGFTGAGDRLVEIDVPSGATASGAWALAGSRSEIKGSGAITGRVTLGDLDDVIGLDPAGPDGDISTTGDNPSRADLDDANALTLATVNLGGGNNKLWAESVGSLTAGAGSDTVFLGVAETVAQSVDTGAGSDKLYVAGRRAARGSRMTLRLGETGAGNASQLHLCNESVSAAGCGADSAGGDYAYDVLLDASGSSGWTVSVHNEASSVQSWLTVKGTATLANPGLEDTFLRGDGAAGSRTTITGAYRIENGSLDSEGATAGTVFQLDLSEETWAHDTLVFAASAAGATAANLVKVPTISLNLITSQTVGTSSALLEILRVHKDSDIARDDDSAPMVNLLGVDPRGDRIFLDGHGSRKHGFLIKAGVDGNYLTRSLERFASRTIALPGDADADVTLSREPVFYISFSGAGEWRGDLTGATGPGEREVQIDVGSGITASGTWTLTESKSVITGPITSEISGSVTLGNMGDTIGNHDSVAPSESNLVFGGALDLGGGENKVRAARAMGIAAGDGDDLVELGSVISVTGVNVNLGGGMNSLSLRAASAADWGGSYGDCESSAGQVTCSGGGAGMDTITVGQNVTISGPAHLGAGSNVLKGEGTVSGDVTMLEGNDTIGLDPAGPDGNISTAGDNPSQAELDAANALALSSVSLGAGSNKVWALRASAIAGGGGSDTVTLSRLAAATGANVNLQGGENSLSLHAASAVVWGGSYGNCAPGGGGQTVCSGGGGDKDTITVGQNVTVSEPMHLGGGDNALMGAGAVSGAITMLGGNDAIGLDPGGLDGNISTAGDNPSQAALDAANALSLSSVDLGDGSNTVWGAAKIERLRAGAGNDTVYLDVVDETVTLDINAGAGVNKVLLAGSRAVSGGGMSVRLDSQGAADEAAGDSNMLFLCNEGAAAGACAADPSANDYAYNIALDASQGPSGWSVRIQNQPSSVRSRVKFEGRNRVELHSPELESTQIESDGKAGGVIAVSGTYKMLDVSSDPNSQNRETVFTLDVDAKDWSHDRLVFESGAAKAPGADFVQIPLISLNVLNADTPEEEVIPVDIARIHVGSDVTDIKIVGEAIDPADNNRKVPVIGDQRWSINRRVAGGYARYFLDPRPVISRTIEVPSTRDLELGYARNFLSFSGVGAWTGSLSENYGDDTGATVEITVPAGVTVQSARWDLSDTTTEIKGAGSISASVTLGTDKDDTIGIDPGGLDGDISTTDDNRSPEEVAAANSLVFEGTLVLGNGRNVMRAARARSVRGGSGIDTVTLSSLSGATAPGDNVNLGHGENSLSLGAARDGNGNPIAASWGASYGECARSGGQTSCSGGGSDMDSITVGQGVTISGSIHLGAGSNALKGAGAVSGSVTALGGDDTIGIDPAGPDGDISASGDNPSPAELAAANSLSLSGGQEPSVVDLGEGSNRVWALTADSIAAGSGSDTVTLSSLSGATAPGNNVNLGDGENSLSLEAARDGNGNPIAASWGASYGECARSGGQTSCSGGGAHADSITVGPGVTMAEPIHLGAGNNALKGAGTVAGSVTAFGGGDAIGLDPAGPDGDMSTAGDNPSPEELAAANSLSLGPVNLGEGANSMWAASAAGIEAGGGNDRVTISNGVFGNVNLGAGGNTADIAGGWAITAEGGGYSGGSGEDTLTLRAGGGRAFTLSRVNMGTGSAVNRLYVVGSPSGNAGNATVTLSLGQAEGGMDMLYLCGEAKTDGGGCEDAGASASGSYRVTLDARVTPEASEGSTWESIHIGNEADGERSQLTVMGDLELAEARINNMLVASDGQAGDVISIAGAYELLESDGLESGSVFQLDLDANDKDGVWTSDSVRFESAASGDESAMPTVALKLKRSEAPARQTFAVLRAHRDSGVDDIRILGAVNGVVTTGDAKWTLSKSLEDSDGFISFDLTTLNLDFTVGEGNMPDRQELREDQNDVTVSGSGDWAVELKTDAYTDSSNDITIGAGVVAKGAWSLTDGDHRITSLIKGAGKVEGAVTLEEGNDVVGIDPAGPDGDMATAGDNPSQADLDAANSLSFSSINLSTGDNKVWAASVGTLTAGSGDDKIVLKAGLGGVQMINAGTGNNTLHVTGRRGDRGKQITLDLDSQDDGSNSLYLCNEMAAAGGCAPDAANSDYAYDVVLDASAGSHEWSVSVHNEESSEQSWLTVKGQVELGSPGLESMVLKGDGKTGDVTTISGTYRIADASSKGSGTVFELDVKSADWSHDSLVFAAASASAAGSGLVKVPVVDIILDGATRGSQENPELSIVYADPTSDIEGVEILGGGRVVDLGGDLWILDSDVVPDNDPDTEKRGFTRHYLGGFNAVGQETPINLDSGDGDVDLPADKNRVVFIGTGEWRGRLTEFKNSRESVNVITVPEGVTASGDWDLSTTETVILGAGAITGAVDLGPRSDRIGSASSRDAGNENNLDFGGDLDLGDGNNQMVAASVTAAGSAASAISAGDGNDTVTLSAGATGHISLGGGDNTAAIAGGWTGQYTGGAGEDTVTVTAGAESSLSSVNMGAGAAENKLYVIGAREGAASDIAISLGGAAGDSDTLNICGQWDDEEGKCGMVGDGANSFNVTLDARNGGTWEVIHIQNELSPDLLRGYYQLDQENRPSRSRLAAGGDLELASPKLHNMDVDGIRDGDGNRTGAYTITVRGEYAIMDSSEEGEGTVFRVNLADNWSHDTVVFAADSARANGESRARPAVKLGWADSLPSSSGAPAGGLRIARVHGDSDALRDYYSKDSDDNDIWIANPIRIDASGNLYRNEIELDAGGKPVLDADGNLTPKLDSAGNPMTAKVEPGEVVNILDMEGRGFVRFDQSPCSGFSDPSCEIWTLGAERGQGGEINFALRPGVRSDIRIERGLKELGVAALSFTISQHRAYDLNEADAMVLDGDAGNSVTVSGNGEWHMDLLSAACQGQGCPRTADISVGAGVNATGDWRLGDGLTSAIRGKGEISGSVALGAGDDMIGNDGTRDPGDNQLVISGDLDLGGGDNSVRAYSARKVTGGGAADYVELADMRESHLASLEIKLKGGRNQLALSASSPMVWSGVYGDCERQPDGTTSALPRDCGGAGTDIVSLGASVTAAGRLELGEGNNALGGEGIVTGEIFMGGGDDRIGNFDGRELGAGSGLRVTVPLSLGGGNNSVRLAEVGNVKAGAGNDYVETARPTGDIDLGEGSNELVIQSQNNLEWSGTYGICDRDAAGSITSCAGGKDADSIALGAGVMASGDFYFGDGANVLKGAAAIMSHVSMGEGADTVGNFSNDADDAADNSLRLASIDLGGGANRLRAASVTHPSAESASGPVSAIVAGSGDDTIEVGGDVAGDIKLGAGRNILAVAGTVGYGHTAGSIVSEGAGVGESRDIFTLGNVGRARQAMDVKMGGGENELEVGGRWAGTYEGGSGSDTVILRSGDSVNLTSVGMGEGENRLYVAGAKGGTRSIEVRLSESQGYASNTVYLCNEMGASACADDGAKSDYAYSVKLDTSGIGPDSWEIRVRNERSAAQSSLEAGERIRLTDPRFGNLMIKGNGETGSLIEVVGNYEIMDTSGGGSSGTVFEVDVMVGVGELRSDTVRFYSSSRPGPSSETRIPSIKLKERLTARIGADGNPELDDDGNPILDPFCVRKTGCGIKDGDRIEILAAHASSGIEGVKVYDPDGAVALELGPSGDPDATIQLKSETRWRLGSATEGQVTSYFLEPGSQLIPITLSNTRDTWSPMIEESGARVRVEGAGTWTGNLGIDTEKAGENPDFTITVDREATTTGDWTLNEGTLKKLAGGGRLLGRITLGDGDDVIGNFEAGAPASDNALILDNLVILGNGENKVWAASAREITGGDGNDTIKLSGDARGTITLGGGSNTFEAASAAGINGGAGADSILLSGSSNGDIDLGGGDGDNQVRIQGDVLAGIANGTQTGTDMVALANGEEFSMDRIDLGAGLNKLFIEGSIGGSGAATRIDLSHAGGQSDFLYICSDGADFDAGACAKGAGGASRLAFNVHLDAATGSDSAWEGIRVESAQGGARSQISVSGSVRLQDSTLRNIRFVGDGSARDRIILTSNYGISPQTVFELDIDTATGGADTLEFEAARSFAGAGLTRTPVVQLNFISGGSVTQSPYAIFRTSSESDAQDITIQGMQDNILSVNNQSWRKYTSEPDGVSSGKTIYIQPLGESARAEGVVIPIREPGRQAAMKGQHILSMAASSFAFSADKATRRLADGVQYSQGGEDLANVPFWTYITVGEESEDLTREGELNQSFQIVNSGSEFFSAPAGAGSVTHFMTLQYGSVKTESDLKSDLTGFGYGAEFRQFGGLHFGASVSGSRISTRRGAGSSAEEFGVEGFSFSAEVGGDIQLSEILTISPVARFTQSEFGDITRTDASRNTETLSNFKRAFADMGFSVDFAQQPAGADPIESRTGSLYGGVMIRHDFESGYEYKYGAFRAASVESRKTWLYLDAGWSWQIQGGNMFAKVLSATVTGGERGGDKNSFSLGYDLSW